jgi:hypothetical protein
LRLALAAARNAAVAATAPAAKDPMTAAPVAVPAAATVLVAVAVAVPVASEASPARNVMVPWPKIRLTSTKRLRSKKLTSATRVIVTPSEATIAVAARRAGI